VMARPRRSRPTHRTPGPARASTDEAALRAILADLMRLERHRETVVRRRGRTVERLVTSSKAADARRLAHVRHQLHDALQECLEVRRLRGEIEAILAVAKAKLAALELESRAALSSAVVRYLAANAKRRDKAEHEVARSRSPRDIAAELAKSKHATAITIADRNKMRDALATLAADPELTAAADEWRAELAVQEATVAELKRALHLLFANATGGTSAADRRHRRSPS
jgi:hypothetical protein